MTDQQIVKKVISGDHERFSEIISRYESPLRRYVLYLIHDPFVTEDVLQDTFIKCYQNLESYNTKYAFSSWLYRIAHNTAMDAVKKKKFEVTDDVALEKGTTIDSKVAEKIDREILAKDVHRCLYELPIKYRDPVVLHFLSDKSYQAISDILRLPVATVGVRINRAKAKLRIICKRQGGVV